MELFITIIVCIIAGCGAGLGTGFAGMSAAVVITPILTHFWICRFIVLLELHLQVIFLQVL